MIIIIYIIDICLACLHRRSQKNEIDVFILTTRFEKYGTTKDLIELYIRDEYHPKHSSYTAKHKDLLKAIIENVRNPEPLVAKKIFEECYAIVTSDLLGKVLKVNKRKKHIENLRAEFSKNYILCYDKLISEVYNLSFEIDIDLNEKKEKDIECDDRVVEKVLTHLIFHFVEFYLKNQILDKQAYLMICQKINAYSLSKILKKYLNSNFTKYIKGELNVRIEGCKVLDFFQKSRIKKLFNKIENHAELESIPSYLIILDPFSFINTYVDEDMNYFEYYAKILFVGLHSFSKLIDSRPVEKICEKKIIGTSVKIM
ncbi:hypothetical protein COBT_000798 [Conglomerata obtusa]